MTAFDKSTDLPANINTLERLHVWSGLALARLNPVLQVLEVPGFSAERVAQSTLIKADDGTNRIVIRTSIAIDGDYATDTTTKFWMKAIDLSNTTLPNSFKS